MPFLVILLFILLTPVSALANCITLDITLWTVNQRSLLSHVIATAANDTITVHVLTENSVEVCTPTVDLATFDSATLQAAAQALFIIHEDTKTARPARRNAADIEVRTNNLCTATYAEVENRLETIQATVQAAIDAIDATGTVAKVKTALTLENDRRTAIDKQLAKCLLGRATLQGQE